MRACCSSIPRCARALVVLTLVAALLLPATGQAQQATAVITIYDSSFVPAELTVPPGTLITWQNAGRAGQTTTSPGIWDSGPLPTGGTWSAVLGVEGVFDYVSAQQPTSMRGRITVQALRSPLDDGTRGTSPSFGGVGAVGRSGDGRGVASTVLAALATLVPVGDADVRGTATLLQAGDGTAVVVSLDGLMPGASYAGAIRRGGCEGVVVFPLASLVGEAPGQASASTAVNAALDANNWWIEYHAVEPPGPQSACGAVRAGSSTAIGPTGSRCPERQEVATQRCN
jgi:plastocyanin